MDGRAWESNGFMDEEEVNLAWPRKYVSREEYLRMMKTCERCGKEMETDFINTKGLDNRCCQDCHSEILKAVNKAIGNGTIDLRDDELK